MLTIEGNIVNTNKIFRGRIEIDESGIISKIGEPKGVADFIFKDELIFPGFIDLHVHAREDASHTQDYKEDFKTASEAAINGGVVAFIDMPNNPVPPVDDASYDAKNTLTNTAAVQILLYAGIQPGTKPLTKKVPYKLFMGHSIGDLFFNNREALEETLSAYKGQSVSFHCEDPKILEENKGESTHGERRPEIAEIAAVETALLLIEKFGLHGKICHVSTAESVRKIIEAKKRGVDVTVEVTPTHLFFDNESNSGNNSIFMQMNPPVRDSKSERLELIQYLKNGDIDYLATDHAPHTMEEKAKGTSGLPQLDTYGPFATWLMAEHGFAAVDVARVCAQNPAQFFNQFVDEKYGKIEQNFTGSLTIINPNKPVTINKEMLKTKCGWSPFEGVTFPGSVVATIVKGKIYAK